MSKTAGKIHRVDYPKLQPVAELGPGEYIVALYKCLGWDGEGELDPRKIVVNAQQWRDVCADYNALSTSGFTGLLWVNSGPSASDDVPYGKVNVTEGAFGRKRRTVVVG